MYEQWQFTADKTLLKNFVVKFKKKKSISEDILGKIDQKLLLRLADFCHKVCGVGRVGVNPLKKEKLRRKCSPNNVEGSFKKLKNDIC